VARNLTRDQEREVMRKTIDMIRSRTGVRPFGWRSCTQSPNSLELLMEHGFLWNSNSFSHDLPFLWEANGRTLVELPRQPFGDGRTYQHRHNDAGNPADTLVIWKAMFDEFHEESKIAPTYCPFQFHPYISGRPGRAKTLRTIIAHMKQAGGVWFATGSDVARWCMDEVFKADRAAPPLRVAAS
jgi:peptidoglycan/xylan/chitin deacetylase (PgdA/CDA1 family)